MKSSGVRFARLSSSWDVSSSLCFAIDRQSNRGLHLIKRYCSTNVKLPFFSLTKFKIFVAIGRLELFFGPIYGFIELSSIFCGGT